MKKESVILLSLTIKEQQEKDKQKEGIVEFINSCKNDGLSLQGKFQKALIISTCYAYRWNCTSMVELLLNSSTEVKFLSTDGLGYWVRQIAGFKYKFDAVTEKFTNVSFNRDPEFKSEQGVVFTFDKVHVATLKLEKLSFWKIAPHVHKELTLTAELNKLCRPLTDKIARGLLANVFTDDEVVTHLATLIDQIKTAKDDKKNKQWVADFLAQNTSPITQVIDAKE
jgi:hypothetical protein